MKSILKRVLPLLAACLCLTLTLAACVPTDSDVTGVDEMRQSVIEPTNPGNYDSYNSQQAQYNEYTDTAQTLFGLALGQSILGILYIVVVFILVFSIFGIWAELKDFLGISPGLVAIIAVVGWVLGVIVWVGVIFLAAIVVKALIAIIKTPNALTRTGDIMQKAYDYNAGDGENE